MSAGLPSDEVAEDYKNSLEDLNQNSRYEISNLTIIAKENMDHALAISRVLENHIKTAPPNRKLTALYVLDSVVKNVGTPYTLFFGRNLYQTFMNAYTLVDSPVRKKLEEMLKTWKEPVPGSLDSRPVFPVEVTRNIENALIKARTAAVQLQQQQQQQARGQSGRSPTPWRNTPTPPGFRPADPSSMQHQMYLQQQPNPPGHVSSPYRAPQATNGVNTFNNHAQSAQFQPYVPQQQNPVSLAQQGGSSVSHVSVGALNDDISHLIARARAEFAANPLDTGIQQRLKALFDLQEILQSQSLPFEQLKQIHDQVSQLSLGSNAPPQVPAPQPTIPNLPQPLQHISPQKQQPPPQQQQSASLQSLFPPNALAALMASVVPPQQATPPPPTLPGLQQSHAQSQLPEVRASGPASSLAGQQAASSETGENPLIQALRAAGMLTSVQNTNSHPDSLPVKPPPSNVSPHVLLSRNSQQNGGTKNHSSISDVRNDATLTSSSLKISRPHLVASLYEAQPNQCKTCGRRFLFTSEERQKKARHLDWHFRVNIRLADATKRGQSRSWYVDEMEWIKSRENFDEAPDTDSANGSSHQPSGSTGLSATDHKKQWIPVPDDPSMANSSCPICQEKFETLWHDEAQEWVWMDAIKVGGRIYHASCHSEATKDGVGTPVRGLTPDPQVLGKRKAEESDLISSRAKMKKEVE